ncbi:hypothetical protein [Butyricimonas synergistica]|uniref:hypothetical protein n=1 Tax=Butyricimonas synergistica TaxID=544644 RepID=UPI00035E3CC4|nr:hypothetical protein [Butyricimonas synergistica]
MIDYRINPKYKSLENAILDIPHRFEEEGKVIEDNRNVIKILDVEGLRVNVKSFKKPNVVNQFAYAYIRKGKALRSFEYANLFREKGIGTPEPVAYIVFRNVWGVTRSYYISQQVDYDYLFRDLREKRPADLEFILREFTRFTHYFHSQSIYFVDHSPGNTLIKRTEKGVEFSLVDLNRVKFISIPPLVGLKNFCRLNATDDMIDIIADEYARLTNSDSAEMTRLLKEWTHDHDERVRRRKEKKKKSKKYLLRSL